MSLLIYDESDSAVIYVVRSDKQSLTLEANLTPFIGKHLTRSCELWQSKIRKISVKSNLIGYK
jgi:hypothetical protein